MLRNMSNSIKWSPLYDYKRKNIISVTNIFIFLIGISHHEPIFCLIPYKNPFSIRVCSKHHIIINVTFYKTITEFDSLD